MPRDSHRKAAEFQQRAAHAHLAASQHGKQDHQTGHARVQTSARARGKSIRGISRGAAEVGKAQRRSTCFTGGD
jgi:hypothetical protein